MNIVCTTVTSTCLYAFVIHMKFVNFYSQNDKALSLNAPPAVEDHYLVVGDFSIHSQSLDGQINREVREQLGGSDHRPVLLTMNTYISCESTLPRWNYKKADWTLYSQLTDQVTKDIRVEGRDINKVVKDFNAGILTAAHKSITRGARQNYKPCFYLDQCVL